MELGRPNQEVFADTLLELASADRNIVVITSDSRGSGKLVRFGQMLPDQIIEMGIAEQNLVGVAAGLAAVGKTAFAVSPACFLTARSLEQIKNDMAYSDRPVKAIGISAGVSYGALGTTHHSLHDYAVLRTINNIAILAPGDNLETSELIKAMIRYDKPVYMRLGKASQPNLHAPNTPVEIGKAITLRDGDAVTFIAIGEALAPAYAASQLLEHEGVAARVISMHTLKPFDAEAVLKAAKETRALITVEEHSVYGGLGEACASLLLQHGLHVPFKIVGIPDEHTVTGSQAEIFNHYGLSATRLAETARQLIGVVQS
jgi:transketolase